MNDTSTFTLTTVIAWALWTVTVISLVTTWILMGSGHQRSAVAMGLTAGVIAPAAAVATIRNYTIRVCGLIRATAGLEGVAHRAELHNIRGSVQHALEDR
jgi:hypothetical protein